MLQNVSIANLDDHWVVCNDGAGFMQKTHTCEGKKWPGFG